MRYALVVEYDGSNFHGSQFQPGIRTVEGELKKAHLTCFSEEPKTKFASRTDSGVHSLGQVVAIESLIHLEQNARIVLNHQFMGDMRIVYLAETLPDFEPRLDAKERTYYYKLTDRELSVFSRKYIAHTKYHLQLDKMQQIAQLFIGTHDYSSIIGMSNNKNSVSLVSSITIEAQANNMYNFVITGKSFVYHQIRKMIELIAKASDGRTTETKIRAMLKKSQYHPIRLLPPYALYLRAINYGYQTQYTIPLKYTDKSSTFL